MVLEGATSSDSFTEDTPSSDIDHYATDPARSTSLQATTGSGAQSYRIKIEQLPKPFFPMSGEGNRIAMTKSINDNCRHAAGILKRPLNQDEVDAISFHFAKSIRTVSMGMPLGVALGALYAYRGREKFTFPGWQMKEGSTFNPDKFTPLLQGQRARVAWHLTRFNVYAFVGAMAGTLFFSTYATTLNAVGTGTDPRLQDYINALKVRADEQRAQQQPQQRPVGQRNPVSSQEGRMDQQAQRAAQRLGMETQYNRQDVQRKVSDYDDMSPTSGSGSWADENASVSSDTGLLSDSQMRSQEIRHRSDSESSVSNDNRANTFSMDKATTQPRTFDQRDDASPTSPTARSTSSSSSNSGSTWARIRQEAATGKHSSQQPAKASAWPTPNRNNETGNPSIKAEQRQGSSLGDSFTFSETDEERQLAKTEAQNEFDARVERERHGGDFQERGGQGGWRR